MNALRRSISRRLHSLWLNLQVNDDAVDAIGTVSPYRRRVQDFFHSKRVLERVGGCGRSFKISTCLVHGYKICLLNSIEPQTLNNRGARHHLRARLEVQRSCPDTIKNDAV